METKKNKQKDKSIFLVLVPHQEARAKLRKNFDMMIKNGLKGVYNFPFVSPLASLSRPLNTDELKTIAHSLRETLGDEKITIEEYYSIDFPVNDDNTTLFGQRLSLDIPSISLNNINTKIKTLFHPTLIGTCLMLQDKKLNTEYTEYTEEEEKLTNQNLRVRKPSVCLGVLRVNNSSSDELSFRAAAVANMYWRPCRINEELCFKWKIGKLSWLPKQPR